MVMQSLKFGLQNQVKIDFKLPVVNVFQTPYGFSNFNSEGILKMAQKTPFARGAIQRQVGFDKYHVAQNLLFSSYQELFAIVREENTTLSFEPESTMSSPPVSGSETVRVNLKMLVPPQQEIRVRLPFLETFKIAYM